MQPKNHFRDTMLPVIGTQTSHWSGQLAINHSQKQKDYVFEHWLDPTLNVCLSRRQVENFYKSIPPRVSQETVDVVASKRFASAPTNCFEARTKTFLKRDPACVCVRVTGSKTFLDNIKTQISSVAEEIPLDALSDASQSIEQAQSEINRLAPQILHIDSIR